MALIETPRYEDFDIKYHHKVSLASPISMTTKQEGTNTNIFLTQTNRFNYLGHGYTARDLDFSPDADRSPYLDVKNLDPRYYK